LGRFYFIKIEDVGFWSFTLLLPADFVEIAVFVSAFGLGCWLVVVTAQPAETWETLQ
jgi:hypothetical protein